VKLMPSSDNFAARDHYELPCVLMPQLSYAAAFPDVV
jgi:hypothetical protein